MFLVLHDEGALDWVNRTLAVEADFGIKDAVGFLGGTYSCMAFNLMLTTNMNVY